MLASMNRVIVFVADVQKCASFYRDAFDLDSIPSDDPAGWQELDAGSCRLAFHKANRASGPKGVPNYSHKIVFYSDDVAAIRDELTRRGIKMGKVRTLGDLVLCDGRDPEGHRFQVSNRR